MKLSFIAPSGYGKSTITKHIQDNNRSSINLKLAEPLYQLQNYFYSTINKNIEFEQDGELLQFLGYKIQKENPSFLAEHFLKRLKEAEDHYEIITNDDCRCHNYHYLKSFGFVFIKVNGFIRNRGDHTRVNPNHEVEKHIENIICDYEINNYEGISELINEIDQLLIRIKKNGF